MPKRPCDGSSSPATPTCRDERTESYTSDFYGLKGGLLLNVARFHTALESDKRENDSSQQSDDQHAYETACYRIQSEH